MAHLNAVLISLTDQKVLLAIFILSNVCQWNVIGTELIDHNGAHAIAANRFFSARMETITVSRAFLVDVQDSIVDCVIRRNIVSSSLIILLLVV